jgi:putative heme-binding domain-containing protein
MNKDHDYGGVVDNQLRALDHIGIFKTPLGSAPGSQPKFINPYDERADLSDRARTYLHVNCSICHVSDGGGNSYIELAYGNTLAATKAVGGRPMQGTFGISDARIIAPGEPERSVLYYRIASLGGARMPRVGSRVADEKALELFSEWIARMPAPQETAASCTERAETAALLKRLQDGRASARDSRAQAIRSLTATTSRAIALAWALGRGALPAPVRGEVIAMTQDHPSTEVRDLFERFVPESQRIRRLGDVIDPKVILDLKGDARRGRAIFAAESVVNCKSCHRLEGVGVEIGPDLSKIGAKYPLSELLQQILEPSRSVDPKYTVYRLETNSGLVHSGLLVERTEKAIVLREAQNAAIRIAVSDVAMLSPEKQSLMPDLLLRSLTAQQAADLLAYLGSLK